jgi:hypothetical protein
MLTADDRVRRAKHHLDDLDSEVDEFLGRDSYDSVTERKPKGTGYLFMAVVRENPDPQWGLIAGDFIHNLRASLDNLMWEVVSPSLRTDTLKFPLKRDPCSFKTEVLPWLAVCAPDVIAAIENSQPYKRPHEEIGHDRLLLLNNVWNKDKHRAAAAIGQTSPLASLVISGDDVSKYSFKTPLQTFEHDDVIGATNYPGPQENLHPNFAFDVAFEYVGTKRPVARFTLRRMYQIVAEEVFPAFGRTI